MSDESKKIEVIMGQKCEVPADAEILDLVKPGEEEVGGRYLYSASVVCPYCYCLNQVIADTDVYKWFRCWNDGYVFRY